MNQYRDGVYGAVEDWENSGKPDDYRTPSPIDIREEASAYRQGHPELAKWLKESGPSFAFAASLDQSIDQWGSLTPKQLAAAQKCMARSRTRLVETEIDLTDLPAGRYAVPDGETRLKLRVSRPADKESKWYGWTFVDDGAEYGNQTKYGSQKPDGKYRGRLADQLKVIIADPQAASIAYGKLVGRCGVCGRVLEDVESVARGIGPICASKMGW